MALTELQMPIKQVLYGHINSKARSITNHMAEWKLFAEFLADMGPSDLTGINVPADVQTDLAKFRTALNEIISLFEGNAVTPTNNPKDVMDLCRAL